MRANWIAGGSAPAVVVAEPRGVDAAASLARRWRCTLVPTHELMPRVVGVDAIRRQLASLGTIVDAAPDVRPDGAIAFHFTIATSASATADDAFDALRANGVVIEEQAPAVEPPAVPDPQPLVGAWEELNGDSASVSPSHVVRVDLTRLDELMRGVGDLVIGPRAPLTDSPRASNR